MSAFTVLAETLVLVGNFYLIFVIMKHPTGNSAAKALIANCVAINVFFAFLWVAFILASTILKLDNADQRTQVQLFTMNAILVNGDCFWTVTALIDAGIIIDSKRAARRVQVCILLCVPFLLIAARVIASVQSGSLDFFSWSDKSLPPTALGLTVLGTFGFFTLWLITVTARTRQICSPTQGLPNQEAQDEEEGQEMDVYVIPVVQDDIPTVHDMAWEPSNNVPESNDNDNENDSMSNQTEQGIFLDRLISPLTVSIFGGIRWVGPLAIVMILIAKNTFDTTDLPIKTQLDYLIAMTVWVALQAVLQMARFCIHVWLNFMEEGQF